MWKSPWMRWALLLGFALGGFFDGILLHQILQWHHLLTLVPGLQDLRVQTMWDGYFHALMYLLAAVALWGLWRAHRSAGAAWGRQLAGALLVGFGLWHLVDSVASHWVLGIHRIKVDSPNPLMWDLIWFTAFGLAPLAVGWLLLRRPPKVRIHQTALGVLILAGLTAGLGAWALKPPPGQPFTTAVFSPWVEPLQVFSAVAAVDGQIVWTDADVGVVIVRVAEGRQWGFYRHGALLVSGAGLPAGCFGWSRA